MRHVVTAERVHVSHRGPAVHDGDRADSHPTDVLQDADGSLIVIETGGWFIKGCPLSRVAKPEVAGGIYRIRKAGAPKVNDPRGLQIALDTMTPARLGGLLADPRPVVRDRAIEQLVRDGRAGRARPRGRATDRPPTSRRGRSAVFALHRIGTPAAREAVRAALDDRDPVVRVAAARSIGLARDAAALPALLRAVVTDAPAVRRQAATALEQIGTCRGRAGPAEGVAGSGGSVRRARRDSRAHRPARRGAPGHRARRHASANERRAALIALDQMGRPLEAGARAAVPGVERRCAVAHRDLGGVAPSGLVGPDRDWRARAPRCSIAGGQLQRRRRGACCAT